MDLTLPNMINHYSMYSELEKLVGTTGEVTLPKLTEKMVEVALHGMAGVVSQPGRGNFEALSIQVPFQCLSDEYFDVLSKGDSLALTLRAEVRARMRLTGLPAPMGWTLHTLGSISEMDLGTARSPGATDSSITVQLSRIVSLFNGRERLYLDIWNQIWRVNGKDMLWATHRFT